MNKKKTKKPEKKEDWKSFIGTMFVAFIIAIAFRSVLYEPYVIPSPSMRPNLIEGDYIFVSKFSYGYSKYSFSFGSWVFPFADDIKPRIFAMSEPKRGDMIVFRHPKDVGMNYVKRLIGLPGDKIQMKYGKIYVNGLLWKQRDTVPYIEHQRKIEQYIETNSDAISYPILNRTERGMLDNTGVYEVPEGHYFMMGDNRDQSEDSRASIGFVPYENLIGRAEIIFYSTSASLWNIPSWVTGIRWDRLFTILVPKGEHHEKH